MRLTSILIAGLSLCIAHATRGADFTIDEWNLLVNTSAGWPDNAGHSFLDVVDPFQDSHAVSLANSSASASYNFSAAQEGSFVVQVALEADAQGHTSWFSGASGDIYITPAEDLQVSYEVDWDITLPGHLMTSNVTIALWDPAAGLQLFEDHWSHDSFGPNRRVFEDSGEFVIPAGRTSRLQYTFPIIAGNSSSGHQGHGNGSIEFHMTPEPQSALLLLLPALITRQARKRPTSRSQDHTAPTSGSS